MMNKQKTSNVWRWKAAAFFPLLALLLMAFGRTGELKSDKNTSKKVVVLDPNPAQNTQAQQKMDSTKNGVSQELLKEYQDILNAHKKKLKNGKESYSLNIVGSDKERLEAIFFKMNKKQQEKQIAIFVPVSSIFLPRKIPSQEQIESFKNSKMYGVWINGQRVNNDILNSYKNTDFASVIVSKLEKNATNYGKHYYQVDLKTNDNYQSYYDEVIARKGNILAPNFMK